MKITVNVNLAGLSYTIDQDGYDLLRSYLEDIESRIENINERREMLEDIEARVSDIFCEMSICLPRVVTITHVQKAIETIGSPELFGQKGTYQKANNTPPNKRLMKDNSDKVITGVCSGVAAYLGLDTSLVRILTIVLAIFAGSSIIAYIIGVIIIPAATTPQELELMEKMKQSR